MKRHTSAFTLIEVTLSMLVIALGLLAFFGLGRLGVQAQKETLNDQRCDMLANAIFETLRERNLYYTELARTNELGHTWWYYWEQVKNNSSVDPIFFPPVADIELPDVHPYIIFKETANETALAYDPNRLSLANWNPRYRITLKEIYLNSGIDKIVDLYYVDLSIFPDGDTLSSEIRNYSTTLLRTGGLP